MLAIREIVSRDIFKNYEIPKEFGEEFEMILLPVKSDGFKEEDYNTMNKKDTFMENDLIKYQNNNEPIQNALIQENEDLENNFFLASVYNSSVEENKKEDEIWNKYL